MPTRESIPEPGDAAGDVPETSENPAAEPIGATRSFDETPAQEIQDTRDDLPEAPPEDVDEAPAPTRAFENPDQPTSYAPTDEPTFDPPDAVRQPPADSEYSSGASDYASGTAGHPAATGEYPSATPGHSPATGEYPSGTGGYSGAAEYPAGPAADAAVPPSPGVRMRTVVFGLVLLVIAGAVLVGQLTDVTVDAGAVLLALMIGGGLLLLAGARRT